MEPLPSRDYLRRKLVLVPLVIIALWLLSDNETSLTGSEEDNNESSYYQSTSRHHLAVWTALHRHPPCLRVYRALVEFNLMLWCMTLSLYLWRNTIGNKMVGYLLFQPADHDSWKDESVYFTEASHGKYHQLLQVDEVDGDEKLDVEKPTTESNDINVASNEVDEDNDHHHDPSSNFECIAPPSPSEIANVALDMALWICISLFLFTISSAEGGRYVDGMAKVHTFRFVAFIAAPIFPLLLFLGACAATLFPWKRKRQAQWLILSYTIGAPMFPVTFRDGFIGDVMTSSVRPMQDVVFTIFYLFSGLQGWWKQSHDLDAADLPLESNWLLHTVILPMCMVSPLWWRFCQTLRQAYDDKCRWPYLGNALKYFIAAEVAVFGVYMQSPKESKLWLTAFVVATLYQIWWDIFMDWELLVVTKWKEFSLHLCGEGAYCIQISFPVAVRLRKTRIYSVSWMYWGIFGVNVVLRFCWTLSFLPPHYLNQAGVLSETFDGDLSSILNPTIAAAEIVRRTLWGWLRVEWEAIKVARKEPRLKGAWRDEDRMEMDQDTQNLDGVELPDLAKNPMDISESDSTSCYNAPYLRSWWIPRRMYDMKNMQVLGELCIYATIFTGLGLVAAAHRETL